MEKNNLIIEDGCVKGFVDAYEKEVIIPYGVTKIDSCAFEEYYGLEKVILPKSLIKIGDNAFRKCVSLKMIFIPESVISLGEGVFEYCESLKMADFLHTNIIEVPKMTFFYCNELEAVLFPDCIVKIGKFAFAGCNKINYYSTPLSLKIYESVPFSSFLETIHIPNSIIHIENNPHKNTKIIISEEKYKRFKSHFSAENKIEMYTEEQNDVFPASLEKRRNDLREKAEKIILLLSKSNYATLDINQQKETAIFAYEMTKVSIKNKIEKIKYFEKDVAYDYEIDVTFFIEDTQIKYRYIKKDFESFCYERIGTVEETLWHSFEKERIGLMNTDKKYNDADKFWTVCIMFKDGSSSTYMSTNFMGDEYKLFKDYFGKYIYQ